MPLRVLHLITDLEIGGAETLLCSLIEKLDSERFECSVGYLSGPGTLRDRLEKHGVEVTRFPNTFVLDARTVHRLSRHMILEDIHILHTHLPRAHFNGAIAARSLKKQTGKPVLVQSRHNTNHFTGLRRLSIPLDRKLARVAARILPVSDSVRDEVEKRTRLSPDRITVVQNGIDIQCYPNRSPQEPNQEAKNLEKELGCQEGTRFILLVGSLTPQKGHRVAIDAFSRISKVVPEAAMLLAGIGPDQNHLEKKVRAHGLAERVHFLGQRQDTAALMRACDVYLQPSLWEGFGLATLEAMASGAAVVASRVGGLMELIREGETGYLTRAGDPVELAKKTLELLSQPFLRRELGKRARVVAREQYSIEETARKIGAIYEDIAGPAGPRVSPSRS